MTLDKEKIETLERLLAKEIQAVADLLKENERLETELETTQANLDKALDALSKCRKKLGIENKICCNRDEAMVVYSEVDMSEIVGSK